ncbi:MAG: Glu-tRNA(Gln) amidotransferase GatDE subunit E [Thaumarchaeota archaeon]|nr:Glu-tRNA(Gln) amidotransferase GatDE subunit E [Nitrososphaerota archaeon]|tara:strand:- start:22547 stop:24421 length:1875 start_codon:yes stop_codon:yes gene_type:complete
MSDNNYELKVGLEIHQQLASSTKLFCRCNGFNEGDDEIYFNRILRPTQSELGKTDPAALFESRKAKKMKYIANTNTSCLVEADEEPPHEISKEALDIALTISYLLNSEPVDEIHVMRKLVIDGSNTTGFQRTVIIAIGGELKVENISIPVLSISLEEDASRIIEKNQDESTYSLDRLSVPLIEITLAPMKFKKEETEKIALTLGRLMRTTGKVARGIGTIRQDVNISIDGKNIIEVKGVQQLDMLSNIIEFENNRQQNLIEIKNELFKRGLNLDNFKKKSVDVSNIFKNTESKLIKKILINNGKIMAIKASKFNRLIGQEKQEGTRLGRDISSLVKFFGYGGIFHSDELPNYGIIKDECNEINTILENQQNDAFILLTGNKDNMDIAVKSIENRLIQCLIGIPAETRMPTEEGMTNFMRPRPGSARMYPETDIIPVRITNKKRSEIKNSLPESYEKQLDNYKQIGLNDKLSIQIFDSKYKTLFEKLVKEIELPPNFIAAQLTETLINLSRNNIDISKINDTDLEMIFIEIQNGVIAKESFEKIIQDICNNELRLDEIIIQMKEDKLSEHDIERIIKEIIILKKDIVAERGQESFSILMGEAMKELRGKVDGKIVSEKIRELLKN